MYAKVLLAILMGALLASGADNLSKGETVSLVRENGAFLRECAAGEKTPEDAAQLAGVLEASREEDGAYVRFYCGGAGLAPSSSYYGFYYSPDDVPLDVEGMTDAVGLAPDGDGYG